MGVRCLASLWREVRQRLWTNATLIVTAVQHSNVSPVDSKPTKWYIHRQAEQTVAQRLSLALNRHRQACRVFTNWRGGEPDRFVAAAPSIRRPRCQPTNASASPSAIGQ